MTAERHRIQYGSQVITFDLEYRNRRTLEISVYPDLSIKVKAPQNRTLTEIKDKIQKRASWVMEQKYFFSLFLPKQPRRHYVSGETHLYLGNKYRLKVIESDSEQIQLTRGIISIYTKKRDDTYKIKKQFDTWYRERAKDKFEQRLDICFGKVNKYGISKPPVRILNMSKRWGSCSKEGILILNSHLIKASSQCIDYVIMHELCHLKYFNHGPAFYNLFTKVMPDWERRKKLLNQVMF
jgi:predicted metal-dependent hydrolase